MSRSNPTSASSALGELRVYRHLLIAQLQDARSKLSAIDTLLETGTTGWRAAPARAPAAPKSQGGAELQSGSLKDFIRRVLARSGVMSVADVTAGVRKAGYRTKNKALGHSVSVALTDMDGVEKVGRGQYRMK